MVPGACGVLCGDGQEGVYTPQSCPLSPQPSPQFLPFSSMPDRFGLNVQIRKCQHRVELY